MRFFWAVFFLVTLVVGIALVYIYAGGYDVAATTPHSSAGRWLLETTMRNSVQAGARFIVPPDKFDDPATVAEGGKMYGAMCQSCHGGPGIKPSELARGLRPRPPDLARAASDWKPRELFWIVKHGIKMTGMPAWGPSHENAQLWSVVAFVRKLPTHDAGGYQGYVRGKGVTDGPKVSRATQGDEDERRRPPSPKNSPPTPPRPPRTAKRATSPIRSPPIPRSRRPPSLANNRPRPRPTARRAMSPMRRPPIPQSRRPPSLKSNRPTPQRPRPTARRETSPMRGTPIARPRRPRSPKSNRPTPQRPRPMARRATSPTRGPPIPRPRRPRSLKGSRPRPPRARPTVRRATSPMRRRPIPRPRRPKARTQPAETAKAGPDGQARDVATAEPDRFRDPDARHAGRAAGRRRQGRAQRPGARCCQCGADRYGGLDAR